ncbi:uncharacterized protein G2W53_040983 [Senna tora]|uniref:Uncharacterized protein n=1 Tax=Senna tora TaxID=362788 RepID=A0A834SJ69_9FABA|nr:uncharacterized protein G2W53_040983 [Senna tora]
MGICLETLRARKWGRVNRNIEKPTPIKQEMGPPWVHLTQSLIEEYWSILAILRLSVSG